MRLLALSGDRNTALTAYETLRRILAVEHDNIRHALTWGIAHDAPTALRLAGALWRFWFERCYYEEGERWLRQALAAGGADAAARAKALFGASRITHAQGNIEEARRLLEEALPLAREGADRRIEAFTASDLGWRRYEGDERDSARALWAEALQVAQGAGDDWLVAVVTASLGEAALNDGDTTAAQRFLSQSVDLARAFAAGGDMAGAVGCLLESPDIRREYGNKANIAACLEGLAAVAGAARLPAASAWVYIIHLYQVSFGFVRVHRRRQPDPGSRSQGFSNSWGMVSLGVTQLGGSLDHERFGKGTKGAKRSRRACAFRVFRVLS